MARMESIAVGGYYPTPAHLVRQIAKLFRIGPFSPKSIWGSAPERVTIVDPCAGEGAAVRGLIEALFDPKPENYEPHANVRAYLCELEETRFREIEHMCASLPYNCVTVTHGDAFQMLWDLKSRYGEEHGGATLLYLNPPYDLDPVHGRLEEKFLSRFTDALADDGYLVFIVPFYALKASAFTIARCYDDVSCFRFPQEDFEAFKQVVLIARKRTLLEPDPNVVAKVRAWAADADAIPEMPHAPIATLTPTNSGFGEWRTTPLDVMGLRKKQKPWHSSDRGGTLTPITGILPEGSMADLLVRTYPVAMPPRPAHIAAGIAAGVFNGAMIKPDSDLSPLPPILVKGAFDREFVTVDEKRNKDGEKTGEVQVQQPKLVVTVLDLAARRYHTVRSSAELTNAKQIEDMTTADLLQSYGKGLMKVMLDHCPVMHDPSRPEHQIPLPALSRSLYQAQAQAAMGAVKLLGGLSAKPSERKGRAAFILGEIGSGKTSVALATAKAIQARRVLVMCPPHLLDSWKEQAATVLPEVKVVTLASVTDVDALAADQTPEMVIAIMSREAAKLGHAWEGVSSACPKCGSTIPLGDLAKTRARCDHKYHIPTDNNAREARELALRLLPFAPKNPVVTQFLRGRHASRLAEAFAKRPEAPWVSVRPYLAELIGRLFQVDLSPEGREIVFKLLFALQDDDVTARIVRELYVATDEEAPYYMKGTLRDAARQALLLMRLGSPAQTKLAAELRALPSNVTYGSDPWDEWYRSLDLLLKKESPNAYGPQKAFQFEEGKLTFLGVQPGVAAAVSALSDLVRRGKWHRSKECGEALYQAVPEPRRYPLATYIAKRTPALIDLLVLDEGHEYSGDGSAQGFAAHRLTGLKIPTLMLTGSVMNGYAESLFANQWALDPEFRQEFTRAQRGEFVRRYGYLKQIVEEKDKNSGKVVAFGAMTDRVEKASRTIGNAPGVLPLFVLRYLLRKAVTLHKADLALDLPPRFDLVEKITPSDAQVRALKSLETRLMAQIREDQFTDLAGKLWGQMAELPSFLDRATLDVGNGHGDEYVVAYPANEGGGVVASAPLFPASQLLPKEEWLIAKLRAELAEGRNVMIFTWHTALMPRIARLVETLLDEKCPILDANKVAAGKRQAWINKEVVGKKRRVLVVNPVAVQTGLNNLVWFSTQVWMENPACNAIVFRQATGRVDRIGQKKEVRIVFPIYEGTTQEALHKLLLHKVGVSMSTDGLDAESALQAAGVGESQAMSALAVGRQLYEMIQAAA